MDVKQVVELARRLIDAEQYAEARQLLLIVRPHLPEPFFLHNLGVLAHREGNFHEAIPLLERAVALAPDEPMLHWALSLAVLTVGDLERGWREFEWRLKVQGFNLRRDFTRPQWTGGQNLRGKTILLHAEGGFGDAIQFARYVPMVHALGATVLLECQPTLLPLLRGMPAASATFARGEPLPTFDFHCPLQSLPLAFRTTNDTIPHEVPYLSAPPGRADVWREKLGAYRAAKDGAGACRLGRGESPSDPPSPRPLRIPRIGLAWCGSDRKWPRRTRSLANFAPLAGVCGIEFHGVQFGPAANDPRPPGLPVIDHAAELTDFAETAALLANLDLLITVDTGVAHLGGALAKETWVVLPNDTCFRFLLDRADSPWYPTWRLFRQRRQTRDWTEVFVEVAHALNEWMSASHPIG